MLLAIVLLSAVSFGSVAVTASPSAAEDCVIDLAIVCLDDKVLVYVNWLERRDKLNVIGDIVTIVKKHSAIRAQDRSKLQQLHSPSSPLAPRPPHDNKHQRISSSSSSSSSTSLGPAIDEYFDTHALRISLPWILDDDIDLELDQQGRGKKSKLKQMKKLMSMLGVMMCAKLSLMGPLAMVMIGAKAIKALMLAVVSLTISKMMLLKKFKGGGGGGGGGYGGSVVQADWSSDKDDRDAHLLAYSGQPSSSSAVLQQSSSQQQSQQNVIYPMYEPQGYYGAA